MEPIEEDMDYMARSRPSQPGSRFNVLFIFPVIGVLILLLFIAAGVFQFDLSGIVDSLVGLMILFFFLLIVALFWAFASGAGQGQQH
ncbi:MAG TPA: hypothetical protein VKV40_11235 [Ktedonobacteraceae bacterium]|nr:hypothetical protein [Ktedonobacteraceae bacterium]